jgi:hypothetical protein
MRHIVIVHIDCGHALNVIRIDLCVLSTFWSEDVINKIYIALIVHDEVGFDAVDKYVCQRVINNFVLPLLDFPLYSRSPFSHATNML